MIAKRPIEIKDFELRNKEGNVLISESKAILTHYLHNKENGVSLYQKDVERLISDAKLEGQFLGLCTSEVLEAFSESSEKENFQSIENPSFKFIDLFAGIGGFRMALQELGGKCV